MRIAVRNSWGETVWIEYNENDPEDVARMARITEELKNGPKTKEEAVMQLRKHFGIEKT